MARDDDTLPPYFSENRLVEGNLTADPNDISRNEDKSVVVFRLALNSRNWKGEESTNYVNIKVSNTAAAHCADSLSMGDRVVVYGRVETTTYEKDGETIPSQTILADFIGSSLRFHDVEQKKRSGGGHSSSGGSRRRSSSDSVTVEEESTTRRRGATSSRRSSSEDDAPERGARRGSRRSSGVQTRGDSDEEFSDD